MTNHNVIYVEACCPRGDPLGQGCTRYAEPSVILANEIRGGVTSVIKVSFSKPFFLPSSGADRTREKTFPPLPLSHPPTGYCLFMRYHAVLICGGFLPPHLWFELNMFNRIIAVL